MDKDLLEHNIFNSVEALGMAYNLGNKNLYKQCLASLELDLAQYYKEKKEAHPVDKKLIYLYSKLWELR